MARRQQSRGPGTMGRVIEKPKDFKGSLKRLIKYLGTEKFIIIFVSIIAVIATVLGVFAPRILGQATNEIVKGFLTGSMNFAAINAILLNLVFIFIASIIFNYIQGYIMVGVSMRITYKLRTELSEKIHRLPLKFFDKNAHGDVLSRITNDVDTISNTLSQSMTQILQSITAVLGIIVMMSIISVPLTLVALLVLPLSGVAVSVIVKKSQKYFKIQQETLGELNGHIEEMFTSHTVVKAFSGEKASVEAFEKHNNRLYESGWKANFLSGLMMPIIGFISNIGYVVIVVLGGVIAVTSGYLLVGDIQAFIQYTRQFSQPMAQLGSVAAILQQTTAAAERVFKFLEEEEEIPDNINPVVIEHVKGNVSFENIHFGYDENIPIIKNFSTNVNPGQKIAIVGHTGAGKTTIVKLLMRFYDVNNGSISVDGHDIREFTRDGLRSHFGMVLQDTWLFNGTIMENIRYGRIKATDEEVKQAARAAMAHHFIRSLPDGYNMAINEEADNISAGQKQLLTIARTILSNPDILILDEATSNVDTRTEVQIQKAMDNLMQGRTSFIIAHRLSTIRAADIILVMENGDIVEQGSHENLLKKGGVYTRLYNSQFEGNEI